MTLGAIPSVKYLFPRQSGYRRLLVHLTFGLFLRQLKTRIPHSLDNFVRQTWCLFLDVLDLGASTANGRRPTSGAMLRLRQPFDHVDHQADELASQDSSLGSCQGVDQLLNADGCFVHVP